jgi:hypothetical protein
VTRSRIQLRQKLSIRHYLRRFGVCKVARPQFMIDATPEKREQTVRRFHVGSA